jgi:ferredoxin
MRPCEHTQLVSECPICTLYFTEFEKGDPRGEYRELWDASGPVMINEEPGFFEKALHFKDEYTRWREAGSPITPPEDKAKRREICNACDYRDPDHDKCTKCGCGLDKAPFLVSLVTGSPGRLDMASASCPLPQPKWLALV